MSHDADKLIRQLSLVAFLMAERRLLTARDVKSNVEGYSEMSDEAFARRFYSDRAELTALGVRSSRSATSSRARSCTRCARELLPRAARTGRRRARGAPDGALLPRGQVRIRGAVPSRAAESRTRTGRLLGAPHGHRRARARERARLLTRAGGSPREARVGHLEAAHGSLRLLEPVARGQAARSMNPYALRLDEGNWYVVGHDLDRATFERSRSRASGRHPRFATPRARLDSSGLRRRAASDPDWQIGEIVGRARVAVEDAAVGRADAVRRRARRRRDLRDRLRERRPARRLGASTERPRSPARARRARRRGGHPLSRRWQTRTTATRPASPGPSGRIRDGLCRSARLGPSPERFGVLQALLAHLLAACGDERSATLDALRTSPRPSPFRWKSFRMSSLLNLVNFGGGCYAVYAEHDGDIVRVEGLYGDVFRRPPKLTPLEARAIHRDGVRRADDRSGRPHPSSACAEARGDVRTLRSRREPGSSRRLGRGDPRPSALGRCGKTSRGRDRVHEGRRREPHLRLVEPYTIERELPVWRVHTWDRSVDAARTFRLDRMRSARLTNDHFDARDGFDPRTCAIRASRDCSTPPMSPAGSSSAVRASPTDRRSPTSRTRRKSGFFLRSSRTAARRSSSSHSAFATSWRRSSAPPARARPRSQQTLILT